MPDEPTTSTTNISGGVNISGGNVTIYGDVTGRDKTSGAASTALLRATPPAPPAHFTGREEDLAKLTQLLTPARTWRSRRCTTWAGLARPRWR